MKKLLTLLILGVASIAGAQTSINGAGGTLHVPTAVGSDLTLSGVQLTDHTADPAELFCVVDNSSSTSAHCISGRFYDGHNKHRVDQGTVTWTCSNTACTYQFTATIGTSENPGPQQTGTVTVTATGSTTGADSTVSTLSASW